MTTEKVEFSQLNMMLELVPCGVVLINTITGEIVSINVAFGKILGYSKKEFLEKYSTNYDDLIFKEDKLVITKSIEEFKKSGKASDYEYRIICKDRSVKWVKISASIVMADQAKYAFTSITDINKEKEAEIKARLEQRRFELVAGEMNTTVIEWDEGGEGFYYSSAYKNYAISQVSPIDILNNIGPKDIVHKDDQNIMMTFFEESASGKERVDATLRLKMIDGNFHWCHLIGFYYRDDKGKPTHTIGVIQDVNEEYERTFELNNLLNELPGGVAVYKVTDRLECQYFSDGFAAMTGHTREEVNYLLVDFEQLKKIISEENYYDFMNKLKENNEVGKTLSFVYRYSLPNGSVSWLHVSATMIHKECGNPVYYCVYTKPANESVLYRNIVEDSAIAVFVAEQKTGLILYSNQAFADLCGFESENIGGKTKKQLLKQYNREEILSVEQIKLLSYENYSEFHVLRDNGLYLAVKSKALKWNGTDAYILYIADETTEYRNQILLKKNIEELKRNHIKEKTLLSSIPGGLAMYRIKRNGRAILEYASEGFAELCGYTVEECLAFNDINVNIVAEDIPMASTAIYRAIENNEPIHIIYRLKKKNGDIILNRFDASVIYDAPMGDDDYAVLYAVQTKVTDESKRTIQEQKHYRHILSMLNIAYWEWSKENGFYTSTNFLKYKLSDYDMNAIKENKVLDGIVHSEDRPELLNFLSNSESLHQRAYIHVRLLMKDGTYQWTELIGLREFDDKENLIRISCTLRDINEEWEKQKKALKNALNKAKAANEAKTMFISRISHDMRTPLNGILSITQFMKEYMNDEQGKSDISQLEISGQYLRGLINDTLDISRIENGKMELHPIICNGKTSFDNMIKLAKATVKMKEINFAVNEDEIPYELLFIDLERVNQIIMNIVGNAVKFTQKNGQISLSIKRISSDDENVTVQISIKDTGIGMSKEFIPHLFEAFSQEDNSMTNSRTGTGLGMTISKKLIELMGGELKVESELGRGSCFTVIIPMRKASAQQINEWNNINSYDSADDDTLTGKRILLCEDNFLNQEIAVRILQDKKILVDVAANGKIGLELYSNSRPGYYDVILMDINMPVMDGISTTRAIRKMNREDARSIPIIAMTGNAFDDDIIKCMDAGMMAHLSKPINTKKMFDTIKEMVTKTFCYRRKNILVIDNTDLNRQVINESLEADYNVLEVENNKDALVVLNSEDKIDAVILDIVLLEMDGVEIINMIHGNSTNNKAIIMVLIQRGEESKEIELNRIGVDEFLYKSNSSEEIERHIRKVIHNNL